MSRHAQFYHSCAIVCLANPDWFRHFTGFTMLAQAPVLPFPHPYQCPPLVGCTNFTILTILQFCRRYVFYHFTTPANVAPWSALPIVPFYRFYHFRAITVFRHP